MPSKNRTKKSKGSTINSEESAASQLEEQKLQIEEHPSMPAIQAMLEALDEQERAEQAEQVGNHFAADAAKEWTCSACTRINKATDDACASCDKKKPFGEEDDHDMWLAKKKSMETEHAKSHGEKLMRDIVYDGCLKAELANEDPSRKRREENLREQSTR